MVTSLIAACNADVTDQEIDAENAVSAEQALTNWTLGTNGVLGTNQYLTSPNGQFFAIMQGDGNLCVYKGSGPGDNRGYVWCSMATAPGGQFFLTMQGDGNLCAYKGTGPGDNRGYLWCTMATASGGQFFLAMQDDANLCVYRGTGPGDNRGNVWCSGITARPAYSNRELADRFAPVLKFDSWADDFPMSAQTYYDRVIVRGETGIVENTNYSTVSAGQVPTYYQVTRCGNQVRINYWWFYGYQRPCILDDGSHNGDWENVTVTVSEDETQVAAVTYWAHGYHYTRLNHNGAVELDTLTHPVVYAGRKAHASYYDSDMGLIDKYTSCLFWEDPHSTALRNQSMVSRQNLVSLDTNSEPWMAADRAGSFAAWGYDGCSNHPTQHPPSCSLTASEWGDAFHNAWLHSSCKYGDRDLTSVIATGCRKPCPSGYTDTSLSSDQRGTGSCTRFLWGFIPIDVIETDYDHDWTIPNTDAGLLTNAP
jgi:hypothetical protein